jgi:FkbM family methyltransferase
VPAAAERLRREAEKEGNWYVEEMALDKREGLATLNVMKEDQFSSLLTPSDFGPDIFGDKNTVSKRVSVKTSTLAVQLARYRKKLGFKMAFLKMDTQGNDLAVAIGAGASLREFAGLQSELAIKLLYKNAPSFVESLDYYRTNGFELSAFVPNNTGHLPYLIEIDCIMLRADVIVELASRLA